MSVHADARALTAATLIAHVQHGLLHSEVDIRGGDHEFDADDLFARDLCEQDEPVIAVAKIVYVCGTGNEEFRHFGRLQKLFRHTQSSRAKGTLAGSGRVFATVHAERCTLPLRHGEHAVNTPKSFTQISRKSAQVPHSLPSPIPTQGGESPEVLPLSTSGAQS